MYSCVQWYIAVYSDVIKIIIYLRTYHGVIHGVLTNLSRWRSCVFLICIIFAPLSIFIKISNMSDVLRSSTSGLFEQTEHEDGCAVIIAITKVSGKDHTLLYCMDVADGFHRVFGKPFRLHNKDGRELWPIHYLREERLKVESIVSYKRSKHIRYCKNTLLQMVSKKSLWILFCVRWRYDILMGDFLVLCGTEIPWYRVLRSFRLRVVSPNTRPLICISLNKNGSFCFHMFRPIKRLGIYIYVARYSKIAPIVRCVISKNRHILSLGSLWLNERRYSMFGNRITKMVTTPGSDF